MFSKNKFIILVFLALITLFVGVRFFGVDHLYHQDESKWAYIVAPDSPLAGSITHPPLNELSYIFADRVFGNENLRLFPLVLFFINAGLLSWFVKWKFDKNTALWAIFLFVTSFYSVLASLMVDTDGGLLPLLFLCLATAYFKWKDALTTNQKWRYGLSFVVVCVVGLLVKVSFGIGIAALCLEYIISERKRIAVRSLFPYILGFTGVLLIGVFFVVKIAPQILHGFDISHALRYWKSFIDFGSRNYLQTFIQVAKALMYSSPILVLPIMLLKKEEFVKVRPFALFIAMGLIFYIILFDFSSGALDRYLQFLILPLSIISATVFSRINLLVGYDLKSIIPKLKWPIILSILILATNFLPHYAPPLYPKTEWVSRIINLKWDFLFPFTGGSGPTGFYVSFLFIAICWVIISGVVVFSKYKNQLSTAMFGVILCVGLAYNTVFTEEYLFGKINGNVNGLLFEARDFIASDSSIKRVVVYNDIGEHEIQKTGKYERRLYAAPQFENTYREFFKDFQGHVLYIDIPKIGENNFYSEYLSACNSIYKDTDKYITANILECKK